MRTPATNVIAVAAFMLFALPAWAVTRPSVSEVDSGWELCLCPPLRDIVTDRVLRPDFPQLSPQLTEVVSAQARANPYAALPDDPQWQPVQVPAAWEQAAGVAYEGAGWYRTTLNVPSAWVAADRRIWLEFDAVATAAGVWVDGEWLGGNVGDFVRWRIELTESAQRAAAHGAVELAAKPGTVPLELLVYVDELPGHITQGFLNMIAPHHGGIWQPVRLYATGPVCLAEDGLRVEPDAQARRVTVTAQLDGEWPDGASAQLYLCWLPPGGAPADVYVSQSDRTFSVKYNKAGNTLTLAGTLDAEYFHLWSPDSPHRYEAWVQLKLPGGPDADYACQRFGFRTIEIRDDHQLYLNGERLMVRSQLQWGAYPRVISPAPPESVLRDEFTYIKSLGFNAETVCLVVMPDYYYNLADELGLLVWQEYPTWHNDFNARHLPTYQRAFPAYFKRDANHPSIILRSMSVEAGVEDQGVMRWICDTARPMTDTPVQDNSSWFWLSNPELADWYGEDNYWNNNRWAKHLITELPQELDQCALKPYLIGETIVANPWMDYTGLPEAQLDIAGTDGADPVRNSPDTPAWYPSCYASAVALEAQLRAQYNPRLPAGEDIVRDYLIPQSERYAMGYRRFQIELLHADPRYCGYTLNVVRDIPFLRGGVIDSAGRHRYTPEQWAWHGAQTASPVKSYSQDMSALYAWRPEWDGEIAYGTPVLAMSDGYADLQPLLKDWTSVRWITDAELVPQRAQPSPTAYSPVVLTTVLTDRLADYIEQGGVVVLLASKWPGALGSYAHFFWRDAMFVPPLGPFTAAEAERIIDLLQYDLNERKSEVLPVEALGIADEVDPLIRLLETHDLREVGILDQAFATRAGSGVLIASSLDHENPAGQWLLTRLVRFGTDWTRDPSPAFPTAELPIDKLHELAVARANGILGLEEWRFKLDPLKQGEAAGWMQPGYDRSGWDAIRAGRGWESAGYSYDGLAWYVREIDVPADWQGGKITLVADGVDDAYTVWVNGQAVQTHGSFTDHEQTVWLIQTTTDLTDALIPGQTNTLALQVMDITGQGGVYKPIYLAVE
jgi:hypothetical protein